ncbi:MAG: hypothetical protein ACTSXP_05510, partial [Promethearchaeota archaeon]
MQINRDEKRLKGLPEMFLVLDIAENWEGFTDLFTKIIAGDISLDQENLEKFKDRFNIRSLPHSVRFVSIIGKDLLELDKSLIRYAPDLTINIDDIPCCVVEIEKFLNSKDQVEQIFNYYKLVFSVLTSAYESNWRNIKYAQLGLVLSFNLCIGPLGRRAFPYHRGEFRQVVVFSIEENWRYLPSNSVAYQAFSIINSELAVDDKLVKIKEFKAKSNRYETFYYLNLIYIIGYDDLKARGKKELELSEIADDVEGAVASVPSKIAPFLPDDVIKALTPIQLKRLSPEQLKELSPEQLKSVPLEVLLETLKEKVPDDLFKKFLNDLEK